MNIKEKSRLWYIFLILIYLSLHVEPLICQNLSENNFPEKVVSALINKEMKNDVDTTTYQEIDSKIADMENPYIPLSEFMYADNQRSTISGNLPLRNTDIKLIPTILFAGGLTAVFIAQHIGQVKTIWDTLGKFHFYEDINQDLLADKYGHIFGAYFTSYLLSESLMECGFSYDAASIWGSILGLTYSTYVEINDGFAITWGFSPSDFYSDVAGAAFFIGQHYIPFLQNFTPKFMYFPADWHGENPRAESKMFIDDYSSQTFWLSVNVNNLLPFDIKNYWPSWLQLSIGYSARNLRRAGEDIEYDPNIWDVKEKFVWGSPRYIIALDYDLVKILPDGPGFWKWFRQSLNHIKLPSPAIEFSNSKTRYYLVYPFRF